VIGLIVILAGIASMLLGGLATQRALRRLGSVSRESVMAAQMRGAVPKFAPMAVIGGLLAVIVGIVLVFVL
jgi:hypothetical protein